MIHAKEPSPLPTEIPAEFPTQSSISEGIQETETSTTPPERKIIIVTISAERGTGSFRQALRVAQPHYTILFDPSVFPPEAPNRIMISSKPLGIYQGYVTVDASNAGVILDESNYPRDTWDAGIDIGSDGNLIMGLQ